MKHTIFLCCVLAISACAQSDEPGDTNSSDIWITQETASYSSNFAQLGQGDIVNFPGHEAIIHLGVNDLPSQISVSELTLSPKMLGAPPHIHEDEDEVFIVLKGNAHFLDGVEEKTASAGTVVSLPRGHFHGFWNPYDEPVTMLLIIAPGHFESFFSDVEAAVSEGGPKSPPEIGEIIAMKASERNVQVDMSRLPPSAMALLKPPPQ